MRTAALFTALALLPPLAACSSSQPTAADVPAAEVGTTQDLIHHLGTRGFVLRPAGLALPSVYGVQGEVYEVNSGDYLAIYEFDSAADAERGAGAVSLDVLGGSTVTLYRRGPLLVAYSGAQSAVQLTLTRALGPAVY